MKKLLSLLGSISIIATSSVTVIACGNKGSMESSNNDIEKIIKEFKEEINGILEKHISETKENFLIIEGKNNKNLKFFNKEIFLNYMQDNKNKSADDSIRLDIIEDFYNIFNVTKLKNKINELQKKEKYSPILTNINSVFNNLSLGENDKILLTSILSNSSSEKSWFANAKFSFTLTTNFKNKIGEIEKYEIMDINSLITITDNEKVGGNIQDMFLNIERDFIKTELSKIYKNNLNLINKTYLEDIDKDILNYLNSIEFITNFMAFISQNFNINLDINNNSFNNIKKILGYRENKILLHSDSGWTAKMQKYHENIFVNNLKPNIFEIIDETYDESNESIEQQIRYELNDISTNLDKELEMTSFINLILKMYKIDLTNVFYKIDDENMIEIPDIKISMGFVKEENMNSRKNYDPEIQNNLSLALTSFWKVYEVSSIKHSNGGTIPLGINFKPNAKMEIKWVELGLMDSNHNADQFSNLTHKSLIDDRNYFLNLSKQTNFKFLTSWISPIVEKVPSRIGRSQWGDLIVSAFHSNNNGKSYKLEFNNIFELDYLKLDFKLVSSEETIFGHGRDESF